MRIEDYSCIYRVLVPTDLHDCVHDPQRALELMKKIPKEANDIICMSLIKGVSRASIISHGTLWIQVYAHECLFNSGFTFHH